MTTWYLQQETEFPFSQLVKLERVQLLRKQKDEMNASKKVEKHHK